MNPLQRISSLLKERIGLNDECVGLHVVGEAVRRRMSELKIAGMEKYAEQVERCPEEFGLLIDEAIVPESWFFRDFIPFRVLVEYLRSRSEQRDAKKPWRILSVPCATGEEPYSILLSLLEGGFAPEALRIEGIDISARLLRVAQDRTYRSISFRGPVQKFKERFFETFTGREFRLKPELAGHVRFHRMNALGPEFGELKGAYDVIFCRNLLIYLEERARRLLLQHLDRLLVPGGLLTVGHAEAGVVPRDLFEPSKVPSSFSFYKRSGSSPPLDAKHISTAGPGANRLPRRESFLPRTQTPTPIGRVAFSSGPKPGVIGAVSSSDPAGELETVQRLADAGQLKEAAARCGRYLGARPSCPEGLYLMGILRMAENNKEEAEALFHQVVYLLPHHTEAILHLAHLSESRGDRGLAARWRQRLARIQKRSEAG